MLNFIKSSLKYFIVGILALIPVVIVIQVLVFLETILRHFFIYIYGYSNNIFITIVAFTLSFYGHCLYRLQNHNLRKIMGAASS